MIKEACVENITQSQIAFNKGATRVELCENLAVGGTTPSHGSVIWCKKHLAIPALVMLRPRGGNFLYTKNEIKTIMYDAQFLSEVGVDGIVVGFLTERSMPDWFLIEKLKKITGDIPITFHKAIDCCNDIPQCIREAASNGMVQRFLSSGGADTALKGYHMLNEMIEIAGHSIEIVVAGNVTHKNLDELYALLPYAKSFHGRKIVGDLSANH